MAKTLNHHLSYKIIVKFSNEEEENETRENYPFPLPSLLPKEKENKNDKFMNILAIIGGFYIRFEIV